MKSNDIKMIINMKAVIEKVISFAREIYENPKIRKAAKPIAYVNIYTGIPELDIILLCFGFFSLWMKIKRPVRILLRKNNIKKRHRNRVIYIILCYLLQFIIEQLAFKVASHVVSVS